MDKELKAILKEILLSHDVSCHSAGADVARFWEDKAEEAAAQDDPDQPRITVAYVRARALDRAREYLAGGGA